MRKNRPFLHAELIKLPFQLANLESENKLKNNFNTIRGLNVNGVTMYTRFTLNYVLTT